MSVSLENIKAPVAKELILFEKHFKDSMKSSAPLLDKITYYIVQKKGKQIRPILVFLSAKMCGNINDSTYVGASLVELLHTATLVHDDVVDDSYERRGFFSVNALWKNKIAVLVGDYLLSQGMNIALESQNYHHLHTVSKAIKQMAEGELIQIEKARKLDIKEDIYFDIIGKKTASLIAAACAVGASSTNDDPTIKNKFWSLGEKLGISFQIKDDLFDYGDEEIGKPRGIDIKEKKMTLPLIYALQQADSGLRKKIINYIKNESTNETRIREVISFVKDYGGLEYAEKAMLSYQEQAIGLLKEFEPSETRSAFESLVFFVTKRNL
ncbi:MAG: polyprenyl synthetase family protein [Saprospiraceae bacterium]|nr:polyprenyl synthetase family protein [Saprospiraceae bacterium]